MKAWAIIVAGGSGKRMGSALPKQYLDIGGKPILERTLTPFAGCPLIDGIVIAAPESDFGRIGGILPSLRIPAEGFHVVQGGRERRDSVRNALDAVPDSAGIIVIHDAVRPFITSALVADCIRAAEAHDAVTAMRPLKETVKVVSDSVVVSTPDRSTLWITQTPQAFRREIILDAHRKALSDGIVGTDDCMLVERLGVPVHIIEGDDRNIKITTPTDMILAEAILKTFETE
jgi:2-C-methyl-D-erythritol 4-phosphate cytidylyltransferase